MRAREATRTEIPVAERPPNPCVHCLAGDEELCTGVDCYRCPNHHRKYGVTGGFISIVGKKHW